MIAIKRFLRTLFSLLLSALLVIVLFLLVYTTSLRITLLNPFFIQEELGKLQAYSLAKESLLKEISQRYQIPSVMAEALDKSLPEEWLRSQGNRLTSELLAYLKSEKASFDFRLPLEDVKSRFKVELRQSFQTSTAPELRGLTPQMREKFFTELSSEIDSYLPGEITLPPEQLKMLEEVRAIIRKFYSVSSALPLLAGLLIVLLVLLQHRARAILGYLGIVLLLSGALSFGVAQIAIRTASTQTQMLTLPPPLTPDILIRITKDLLSPVNIFSAGLGALGLICLALLFLPQRSSAAYPRTR